MTVTRPQPGQRVTFPRSGKFGAGGGGGGGGGAGAVGTGPPPGTYDPQLDASLRASNRGLRDFVQDTRRAGGRSLEDYTVQREDAGTARDRGREDLSSLIGRAAEDYRLGKFDIGREYDRSLADVTRERGRGLEDIGLQRGYAQDDYGRSSGRLREDVGTGRTRLDEDVNRQIAELQRRYGIQANQQTQQARAAGVARGGYQAQAERKRAENQAFERQPIDTARQRGHFDLNRHLQRGTQDLDTSLARTLQGLDLSKGRLEEDFGISTGRLGENRDRALQGLNMQATRTGQDAARQGQRMEYDFTRLLGQEGSPRSGLLFRDYFRGVEDRETGEQRARREGREFGQDIAGSKYYQARYGAGTLPTWNTKAGGPRRKDPYEDARRRARR